MAEGEAANTRAHDSRDWAKLAARGLGEPRDPGARPEAHLALERIRSLFTGREPAEDSTGVIRAMRDERTERDARLR